MFSVSELLKHLYKVLECIEAFERTVTHVKEIISFAASKQLREEIKETVKEVHRKEWEDMQPKPKRKFIKPRKR